MNNHLQEYPLGWCGRRIIYAVLVLFVLLLSTATVLAAAPALPTAPILARFQIAAGLSHTCLTIQNDGIYCWGLNDHGELGIGTTTAQNRPAKVAAIGPAVGAVAAGDYHTCVVVDNRVQCWGSNWRGQLGNGNQNNSHAPVNVVGLTGAITQLAAGQAHSCAVMDTGVDNGNADQIWCWGDNSHGQLGNGIDLATTP